MDLHWKDTEREYKADMDLYQNRLGDHSLAIEQGRHRQTRKNIYLFIYNVFKKNTLIYLQLTSQ